MKLILVAVPALCAIGCGPPSQHSEVRSTFRPDPSSHRAFQGAPSAAPDVALTALGPRVHISPRGITLNDVRLETKELSTSLPQEELAPLLASLEERLTRERQSAGSSTDAVPTAAHYALTVEPNVPFRFVKRTIRACTRAGYAFVHLSCGETTFEFFVDEWFHPDADPLVEMHELGVRLDSGALSASVFRVAPSSINRGMFQRTLRIERSIPRATPYIALSEFALATTDLDPPVCTDSGTACFDRLALDADDSMPFGEIMSSLAAMDSGLRPTIPLPWAKGAPVRLSSLRVGTFHPGGQLPPEQISSVMNQNFDRIGGCYADARRKNPKLTGIVRVQFKIDLEGKVIEASEAPEPSADAGAHAQTGDSIAPIRDSKMISCVLSEFAKIQFARPDRAGSLVRYNIRFVP